jgi:hypothetical protein
MSKLNDWRRIENRSFAIDSDDVARIYTAMFGDEDDEGNEDGEFGELAGKISKVMCLRLLMASVGIRYLVGE